MPLMTLRWADKALVVATFAFVTLTADFLAAAALGAAVLGAAAPLVAILGAAAGVLELNLGAGAGVLPLGAAALGAGPAAEAGLSAGLFLASAFAPAAGAAFFSSFAGLGLGGMMDEERSPM